MIAAQLLLQFYKAAIADSPSENASCLAVMVIRMRRVWKTSPNPPVRSCQEAVTVLGQSKVAKALPPPQLHLDMPHGASAASDWPSTASWQICSGGFGLGSEHA